MNLDNVVSRFTEQLDLILPPGMRSLRGDLETSLKSVLKDVLSKMDLLTRDEFNAQATLLARTRAKVDELEGRLRSMEGRVKELEQRKSA